MPVADAGLIGRDEPLARVREAADTAAQGRPRVVLVTGEAGIGRTRFVEAAFADLRAEGWRTVIGRAGRFDGGAPPYLPFVEVLRRLLDGLDQARVQLVLGAARSELAALLPDLIRAPTGSGATEGTERPDVLHRARLFEALLDVAERMASVQPLAVAIEDVQWLDEASADLLRFFVDRTDAGRLLLLVTARTDEPHDGRWRHLLTDLDRRPGTDWLELPRLDRSDLGRLIDDRRSSPLAPAVADAIARRSGGNPRLAEELVLAHERGADLPVDLREAMRVRLDGLSDTATTIVRVAALCTGSFDEDRLALAAGVAPDAAGEATRELVAAQILVVEDEGGRPRLAFRHELLREVVAGTLLPSERRNLHRAIAVAASEHPDTAAIQAAAAAHHWLEAGELPRASEAAGVAHAEALRVAAYAEATHWGRTALQLLPATGVNDPPPALLRSTAEAALLSGDAMTAVGLLREAIAAAPTDVDPAAHHDLRGRLRMALFEAGDLAAVATDAEAALRDIPPAPPSEARAEALAHLAGLALMRRDWHAARALAEDADATAELAGSSRLAALATGILGLAQVELGVADAGLAAVRRAWAAADWAGPHGKDLAYRGLVGVLARLGRFSEVVDTARRGREVAAASGLARTLGRAMTADEAEALVQLGRWSEAAALLEDAEVGEPGDDVAARLRVAAARMRLRMAGPEAARSIVGIALAAAQAPPGSPGPTDRSLHATVRRSWLGAHEVGAEAAVLDRRPALALDILAAGMRSARALRDAVASRGLIVEPGLALEPGAALALWAAREAGAEEGGVGRDVVVAAIDELVPRPIGAFAPFLAAARLTHRRRPDERYHAWEEAAHVLTAHGLEWWSAWAHMAAAEATASSRPTARVATPAARAAAVASAAAIADALESEPLHAAVDRLARRLRVALPDPRPPRDGAPRAAGPGGLTPRERVVLELVARGFTNREIADRLGISHKTASVHVSNILGKLQAQNRTEAAALAQRLGLSAPGGGTARGERA